MFTILSGLKRLRFSSMRERKIFAFCEAKCVEFERGFSITVHFVKRHKGIKKRCKEAETLSDRENFIHNSLIKFILIIPE